MSVKRGSGDWRLRIGHIAPTVWDYGSEYEALVPDGVKNIGVTLGALSFDRDDMAEVRAQRKNAAKLLERKDADCIVAGGVPVSTLDGPDAEDEVISDVGGALSVPFTTSSRCAVDALRAVGATEIALITPFPDERDDELVTYFESYGIDIVTVGGPDVPEPHDVRSMDDTLFYRHTIETLRETGADVDGIYVPCVPFGSVSHIEVLEEDAGVPVVLSAQAKIWKALDMGGINPEITGFGSLFRT